MTFFSEFMLYDFLLNLKRVVFSIWNNSKDENAYNNKIYGKVYNFYGNKRAKITF